jgi:hypothetical protein
MESPAQHPKLPHPFGGVPPVLLTCHKVDQLYRHFSPLQCLQKLSDSHLGFPMADRSSYRIRVGIQRAKEILLCMIMLEAEEL